MVGTSVGALNATYLAVDPTLERLDELAMLWRTTRRADVYPGNPFQVAWRVATGQRSLYPNDAFYRHVQQHVASPTATFADLRLPCYVAATNLDTGALRVLGETPTDSLIDALMATTALPPLHPPYPLDDGDYVDGAAVALLPIEVALKHGAREVYALHIVDAPTPSVGRRTLLTIGGRAIGALVQRQWQDSVSRCAQSRVRLHHIQLVPPATVSPLDYTQSDLLMQTGYAQTMAYLDRTLGAPAWPRRVWQQAGGWLRSVRLPDIKAGWREQTPSG
jgi:NTE family protein